VNALKILIVRPDRLGDVILSTPVFEVVKRHYPHAEITAMVREFVSPVISGLPEVSHVLVYEPDRRHKGVRGFFRLLGDVRRGGFRIAVVLQTNWRIAAAIFFANVRYRVGPISKIHSYFFYNRGIRQRRSQVEMHETDYNLQLLRRLGIRATSRDFAVKIALSPTVRAEAEAWLKERGWSEADRWIAVHPGMGGSALNWPESHYCELIRALLKEGRRVLITGGPGEGALLERVRQALGPQISARAVFYGGPVTEVRSVDFLAALFERMGAVVAPSTGPLHLAVASGRPVVAFYPPIRVQSALRWGPYLKDESRASVLVPEVYCGQDFKCRGTLCNYYPCMSSLTVTQALEQVHAQEKANGKV
jgi:heptosyltransferase-3